MSFQQTVDYAQALADDDDTSTFNMILSAGSVITGSRLSFIRVYPFLREGY